MSTCFRKPRAANWGMMLLSIALSVGCSHAGPVPTADKASLATRRDKLERTIHDDTEKVAAFESEVQQLEEDRTKLAAEHAKFEAIYVAIASLDGSKTEEVLATVRRADDEHDAHFKEDIDQRHEAIRNLRSTILGATHSLAELK